MVALVAGGVVGELSDPGPVRVYDVDVVVAVAVADECNPLPVGRPGGRPPLGELRGPGSVHVHDQELSLGTDERDPLAVRGPSARESPAVG